MEIGNVKLGEWHYFRYSTVLLNNYLLTILDKPGIVVGATIQNVDVVLEVLGEKDTNR